MPGFMAMREISIGEPGVGFGHPFLAYALVYELERMGLSAETMIMKNRGPLATRIGLALVNQFKYMEGPEGGDKYDEMRNLGHGLDLALMTADMATWLYVKHWRGVIVATHYLVAQAAEMLRLGERTILIHVDVKSYNNHYALKKGVVCVPLEQTAEALVNEGKMARERIKVVGAMVHPILLDGRRERMERSAAQLEAGEVNMVVMLSGARPKQHEAQVVEMLKSLAGGKDKKTKVRMLIFPGLVKQGVTDRLENVAKNLGLRVGRNTDTYLGDPNVDVVMLCAGTLREAVYLKAKALQGANMQVTMASENWGNEFAGVPTILFEQQVGPACKSNTALLQEYGVPVLKSGEDVMEKLREWLMFGDLVRRARLDYGDKAVPEVEGIKKTVDVILAKI